MWWGPNENHNLQHIKRRRMIQEHSGVHKGRSAEALSHEVPQIKIKTKHTKRKCRFLRGESLQCSVLKPGARSNCSISFKPLQHFLLFKSSRFWDWNLVHGTHSLLLLEKGFHFQFHKQPHPPEPKLVRSILNFRTSCAVLPSPTPRLTNTPAYTALPTTKFVNMHFLLLLLFSLSLGLCS